MRRSVVLAVLLVVASAAVVLTVLGVLLKRSPDFYDAALDADPGDADAVVAAEVVTRFGDLLNDIRSKPEWGATFTADELNALFRESQCPGGWVKLPEDFHAPRVAVEGDKVRFAVRYGDGLTSTVVSVDLRAWLVHNETNTVALELCGMSAGALPLGVRSLLDGITEAARQRNINVTWYRLNGHPVGLFRFYADQARPTTQIRRLKVEDSRIIIAGRSLPDPTAGGPPATKVPTAE
jgi:hypothetical protein